MARKMKLVQINCESFAVKNIEAELHIDGARLSAVVQALQFACDNKKQFQKEITDCPDCFERVEELRDGLSSMLAEGLEHAEKHIN